MSVPTDPAGQQPSPSAIKLSSLGSLYVERNDMGAVDVGLQEAESDPAGWTGGRAANFETNEFNRAVGTQVRLLTIGIPRINLTT